LRDVERHDWATCLLSLGGEIKVFGFCVGDVWDVWWSVGLYMAITRKRSTSRSLDSKPFGLNRSATFAVVPASQFTGIFIAQDISGDWFDIFGHGWRSLTWIEGHMLLKFRIID
jgi:hypothetical protein